MNTRRYTQLYLSGFVGLLMLVAGFNGVIDAQGVFRLVQWKGINQEKPLLEKSGVRKTKSIDIEQGDFTTMLLGTSRTFGGLDPDHAAFSPGTAYNAALPGTNLYEVHKVFDFSVQQLPLQQVVLELDFTTFSDQRTVDADFQDSRFAGKNIWASSLESLLSLYQLKDSWETLHFNQTGKQARYTEQGFRRERVYPNSGASNSGSSQSLIDHHKLFSWANKQYLTIHTRLDYNSAERMQRLQDMIDQCQAQNIDLYLFIPPLHAHLQESLSLAGLMPEFEQWKRDLVRVVDAHNRTYPNQKPLPLWDFSGLNAVTTESVPSENSVVQMQWYVESSHFRPELGDRILSLMLQSQRPADIPDDFGILLTPQNIDDQIVQLRADLTAYRQQYPDDIRRLNALHRDVLNQLSAKNSASTGMKTTRIQ